MMIVKPFQKQSSPGQTACASRSRLLRILLSTSATAAILGACAAWVAGSMLIGSSHQNVGYLPAEVAGRAVEFPHTSCGRLRGWIFTVDRLRVRICLSQALRSTRLAMI